MKHARSLSTVLAALAATSAWAQTTPLSHSDVAPYTDIAVSARGSAAAPAHWKGQLSRADVVAVLRQARSDGTIAVGDALGYPTLMKATPLAAQAIAPTAPAGQVMGGPPDDDRTGDGYRFVGGEAGWVQHGLPNALR